MKVFLVKAIYLLFLLCTMFPLETFAMPYVDFLFDESIVHEIDIMVDEDDWTKMLESALDKTYISCDISIDGSMLYNVGIRPKGNSSLTNIALDDSTDRFSFKIKFDKFEDNQTFLGLNALMLNNHYNDKSYLKEYVNYKLYDYLGVTVPATSYVRLRLNGQEIGFYLAVETTEESYLLNHFGSLDGNLYKPEVEDMADRFTNPSATKEDINRETNLSYIDDNMNSYDYIFDNLVCGSQEEKDIQELLSFLQTLSHGVGIEDVVDIDSVLKYTAVTVWTVNLDSYLRENLSNNYLLYQNDEKFSVLPWDLNMSFGGLGVNTGIDAVNFDINYGINTQFPLVEAVLSHDAYYQKYLDYLEELNEFVKNGSYATLIEDTNLLIERFVKKDSTKFFTYEDYMDAVPALLTFGLDRATAVEQQISGNFEMVQTNFSIDDLIENESNISKGSMGKGDLSSIEKGTTPKSNLDNDFPMDSVTDEENVSDIDTIILVCLVTVSIFLFVLYWYRDTKSKS